MEDFITLNELYIFNPKLFKTKNLKSFVKNHNISDHDIVKLKNNKIGIKKSWIKKNIPLFNLKLDEVNEDTSYKYFEVALTLEKYGCKTFNPINLNLDSTMIKYFVKEDKRTPFFTYKGLIKIMILFNALPDNIFNWIHELTNGRLQSHINNLGNVSEMVNLNHIPVIKNINGTSILSNHIYNINKDDIIVDFKRIDDLKKEIDLKLVIDDYKCPLYTQLQANFQKGLEDAQKNFNNKLQELKQEGIIQHLQQELEKEKSLKDQALTLTQSFIPLSINNKQSQSPYNESSNIFKTSTSCGKLKPSKIQ
jgi:hypothetical protein